MFVSSELLLRSYIQLPADGALLRKVLRRGGRGEHAGEFPLRSVSDEHFEDSASSAFSLVLRSLQNLSVEGGEAFEREMISCTLIPFELAASFE